MRKSKFTGLHISFSQCLQDFNDFSNKTISVQSQDSISEWKQQQYSDLNVVSNNLGSLSIKYKELTNETGVFEEFFKDLILLREELSPIIESEFSIPGDEYSFIADESISKINIFYNKLFAFVSNCVIRINKCRNIDFDRRQATFPINRNIFIVHSDETKIIKSLEKLLRKNNLNPVIMEKESQLGLEYVFEKFDDLASACGFSIVLLFSKSVEKVSFRPNVMLELGYFLRHVGTHNIIVITNCSENDIPSDIRGCFVIKESNKKWSKDVSDSLKKRGLLL